MKRYSRLCILSFVFSLFFFANIAAAEERILDYAVAVKAETDASFVVTERITVNIENENIIHGIYRLYPVKIREGETGLRHYDFDVLSSKLDDIPVPFTQHDVGYATGIALGDPDREAPLGKHVYELIYRTANHIRFLPDHDELYYNVTGNFWQFPIDHVSFRLELPNGAKPINMQAYTGRRGETGADYRILNPSSLETTHALRQEEGLTVSAAWEKGLIEQPAQSWANIMGANRLLVLLGIPLLQLLVLLLLVFLWAYRGKNVVIPLFSAPEGMSPGEVYCFKHRGFSALFLQTDILWAAVNGYLRLSLEDKKTVILTKTDPSLKKRSRPLPEWAVKCLDMITLFFKMGASTKIDMRKDKAKDGDLVLVPRYLELRKKYEKKLQKMWRSSRFPAVLSTILGFGLFYFAMDKGIYYPGMGSESADTVFIITGGIIGLIMLFGLGFKKSRAVFAGFRHIVGITCSVFMIVVLIIVLLVLVEGDFVFCAGICSSFLLAGLSFTSYYTRLTDKGKKLDTKIRGLEMYIRTAEKDRLAKINAPEDTVEKYEEILPYAVALGCADAWQKRFEPLLNHLDYIPDWIEDEDLVQHGFDFVRYTTVVKTMTAPSAMTQAIDSAAKAYAKAASGYADSSSSGSSGFSGGSSGGGSGGGGGGGW